MSGATEVVYVLTALTCLVPRDTAAFSGSSVYTIRPCTMSLDAEFPLDHRDITGVCIEGCLQYVPHLRHS